MQATVYLYDLYYHFPNYDVLIVAFQNLQNVNFPHHFIQT